MSIDELLNQCDLYVATPKRLAQSTSFSCSNDDLDDFFLQDATLYQKRLLGKTYLFCLKKDPSIIVCAFTLSNDSIRITNKFHTESKEHFLESSELTKKNLRRYPAVLIGRLGTNKEFIGQGIGSAVMDFIKSWFRIDNKTGCRFLIVDAYNNPSTIRYYLKNQFHFLIEDERLEAKYMGIGMNRLPLHTRLMYFDLLDIKVDDDNDSDQ